MKISTLKTLLFSAALAAPAALLLTVKVENKPRSRSEFHHPAGVIHSPCFP